MSFEDRTGSKDHARDNRGDSSGSIGGFRQRKYVIPALVILGLLVAGGVTAAVVAANQPRPVEETAPASEEPLVDPSPEPTVDPYERTDSLPADMQAMATGDLSEYLKTYSQEEQLKFQSWSLQKLPVIAERVAVITGNPVDVLPATSLSNTPAEILTLHNYTLRSAYTLADPSGKLDKPTIDRTVYASFSGAAAEIAIAVTDAILNDKEGNPDGEAYSVEVIDTLFQVDPALITDVGAVSTNDAGYPMISFDYDGEVMYFSYYTFTDYKGQAAARWVQTSPAGL